MLLIREWLALSLISCLTTSIATLQSGPEGTAPSQSNSTETLKVQAREVEISAFVENRNHTSIDGLTKQDFVLKEDGQEQPIRYLHQGISRPLTLAILVDTSGSQRALVDDEIQTAAVFLEGFIEGKQNRATIVQFDRTVSELGSLTNSVASLRKALPQLRSQVPQEMPIGSASPQRLGSTVLNDAVYVTSKSVFAGQTGRKIIVVLTDGCDIGSKTTLTQAIDQAQRADAVVYSIFYSSFVPALNRMYPCGPLSAVGGSNPGIQVLKQLSESTGGTAFEVSKGMPLRFVFAKVAQQIQSVYELFYSPSAAVLPNTYHRLELSTKDKHYTTRARHGFYANR